MNVKTTISVALLCFVAASVMFAVLKVAPETADNPSQLASADTEGSVTTSVSLKSKLAETQYNAVYFHAAQRCVTCRKIERFSHTALLPEIEAGSIAWQVADYTSDANAAMVKQFEVYTSTVVLVEVQDGKVIRWKNLEEVWNHTSNQSDFTAFIHQAWSGFKTT